MESITVRRFIGVLVACGISMAAYAQGAYWESQVSGGPLGDKVMNQKMFYMPKMAKTIDDESGQVVIIRLDKEMIYTLDPSKKEYSQKTFEEMEKSMKKVNSKMAEMQKKLEKMPPEQRKMMEQMLGDKMMGKNQDAPATVTSGNEKRTISGYSCAKHVVNQSGKEIMTVWATKEIKEFEAMRKDWEQFTRRLMAMSPGGAQSIADAFQKIQGFPIEVDMEQGMKTVVTKFERHTTPAAEFEVPPGYTKVDKGLMDSAQEDREE